MTQKKWQISKIRYCEHVGHEIFLESQVVYPSDQMPDQPPHVVAQRCSHALECNAMDKMVCAWCGTNPDVRPS
ncbi:MAG: hypothetical protein IPP66_11490 [Anaerolineales bacterium]|jgi:hypothetical protein|nr:hypothetical protein [Anaerolineales bacterium]